MEDQNQLPPQVIVPDSNVTEPINFGTSNRTTAILVFFVGLLFIGISYFLYGADHAPASYLKTQGKIIGITHESGAGGSFGGGESYDATIKFASKSGKVYEFLELEQATPNSKTIGSTVKVAYDPSQPQTKPVDISNKAYQVWALIFFVPGVLAILAGSIQFFLNSRSRDG